MTKALMNEYLTTSTRTEILLNGEWRFTLDAEDRLQADSKLWSLLDSQIQVPGSWEEQGFGEPSRHEPIGTWKKLREYEGTAWYAREILIPAHLAGNRFHLILAGVRWQSQVWVDGRSAGIQESLTTEHRFELTPLMRPGMTQWLLIKLDNRMQLPLAESHIHSYHTATNWGGITGGARIEVIPEACIEEAVVTPDAAAKAVDLEVALSWPEEVLSGSEWELAVHITDEAGSVLAQAAAEIKEDAQTAAGTGAEGTLPDANGIPGQGITNSRRITLRLALGDRAELWSDRCPVLYRAALQLKRDGKLQDVYTFRFGLRSIGTQGSNIVLNGYPVYMRGYVDCCIFPLTGYPSWDREYYRRQLRTVKAYGFNHVRLHGWTAPEPFWQAADEEGMLVQTELPHWSNWYNPRSGTVPEDVHGFLKRELERIIRSLNTHPSFVMLSMGNELTNQQGHPALNELVRTARQLDTSRLYTDNTGFGELPAYDREGDYYIPTLNWHTPYHIDNAATPNTREDYLEVSRLSDKPLLAHEHGQFTMYVRPSEESKYTGVLRPHWLRTTMETLEAKQLTGRIDEFIDATGTLLVRALKEAMERARRTSGLAGIQLLDIRDFPGQGHATTGILDVFGDSKGITRPEDFRRFNEETVLLMRSSGRTFFAGESHPIDLECSHFGPEPITNARLHWELRTGGRTIHSGELNGIHIPCGKLQLIGRVELECAANEAQALELHTLLAHEGAEVRNHWEFWSFPRTRKLDQESRIWSNVWSLRPVLSGAEFRREFGVNWLSYKEEKETALAITDQLSRFVLQYVLDGGSAWLMAKPGIMHDEVETKFLPIFWNYLWFPLQSGTTMGMVVHDHPLTSLFPHDGKSNWQWYHLVDKTPAIGLDSIPQVKPIVEVIDNFNRAKKLAYAFEVRIGRGKLFVSTFRLTDAFDIKRPETAYLLQQTIRYLLSDRFDPDVRVSVGEIIGLFKLKNRPD